MFKLYYTARMFWGKIPLSPAHHSAKKIAEYNDWWTGLKASLPPSLLATLAESLETMNRMWDSSQPITIEIMNNLPFPFLYELLQNAPEAIRTFWGPLTVFGIGGTWLGSHAIGKGINKLRYFRFQKKLEKELVENAMSFGDSDRKMFAEQSKTMSAAEAYEYVRDYLPPLPN